MTIRVTDTSVAAVCGRSNRVVVYGSGHCKYLAVLSAIEREIERVREPGESPYPLRQAFDCGIGNEHRGPVNTTDGRVIAQIPSGSDDNSKRTYKAGLTNIVLENFARSLQGLPLIPVIFCTDITDNEFPLTAENVLSKTKPVSTDGDDRMNDIITHSELRRAYKLCTDSSLDADVQAVARSTFRFVSLDRQPLDPMDMEELYALRSIDAPWEGPGTDPATGTGAAAWATALATRTTTRAAADASPTNWRGISAARIAQIRAAHPSPSAATSSAPATPASAVVAPTPTAVSSAA